MSDQACHFLRLPIELRLIIYENVLADEWEANLWHPLSHVSEQISDEIMPILLHRVSGFLWTAIACEEEWYLALQPFKKIWRLRLANAVEKAAAPMPALHTTITYHILVGRRIRTVENLFRMKLQGDGLFGSLWDFDYLLENNDQLDGVKRFVRDVSCVGDGSLGSRPITWIERGKAEAPELNKKLSERVWYQQWYGEGQRGPAASMCVFQKLIDAREEDNP